jgi:Domain of unknown function (DUF3943)
MRFITSAACACALLLSWNERTARAEGEEPAAAKAPEADQQPSPPREFRAVRAALELGTVFLIGSAYYVSTSTETPDWDLNYDWEIFQDKVTGEAFGPDANHFGTNFVGHPLGGAGYYLSARSNHGTVPQSIAFAFFGSLIWELFGEISSEVSLNDSIVTPVGGIAIGEATFQLGSYFDRAPDSFGNRLLGALIGPFKTFNDAVDGTVLTRRRAGAARQEEARFELGLGYAQTWEASPGEAAHSSAQLHLSERIARNAPFDSIGTHSRWFHDGDASGIELDLGLGARGVDNLMLDTRAVLAGYTYRNVQASRSGAVGSGGVIGLGTGFQYGVHDYRRSAGGEKDRISAVRPLDLVVLQRSRLGNLRIDSYVEAGPAFGGVRSFALDGLGQQTLAPVEPELLPAVTQLMGYYFGLGGAGVAALGVSWGNLELKTRLRIQGYAAPNTPGEEVKVRLSDTERTTRETLSWAPAGGPTRLEIHAEQRARAGTVNRSSFERSESTLGFAVGVVL